MAGIEENNALKRRKRDDDAVNKPKSIRTPAIVHAFDDNLSANLNRSSAVSRQSASSSTAPQPAATHFNFFDFSFGRNYAAASSSTAPQPSATQFDFFDLSFGRNTAAAPSRPPRRPKLEVSILKKKKTTPRDDNRSYSNKRVGLEGKRTVDFMSYLGERYNFIVVVEKILSYLDGEDLTVMSRVSDTWRDVINRSLPAKQKQASYRSWARSEKENRKNPEQSLCPAAAPANQTRKALNDVTNVDARPPSSDKPNHPRLKFGVLDFLLS